MNASRRSIPSVDKLLGVIGETSLGRPFVVETIRRELTIIRQSEEIPEFPTIVASIKKTLRGFEQSRIQPLINGTGIIINTNLGRSPLAAEVMDRVCNAGSHYVNLEIDLATGRRGNRAAYLERGLAILCGAESATVVNNCAAALLVIIHHFITQEKNEVIISRGELVQIGGSFRIPDILLCAGAKLREVGMTNKTSISDYASAINQNTALILKVHRSNFFMDGFVGSPKAEEIRRLAGAKNIPYIEDLGSGAVAHTESLAEIEHAQTPSESLKCGADLVCFSGDKLLGGPQAGIIVGKSDYVAAVKREPIFRALRCDKLILCALQSTIDLYLAGTAEQSVPVLSMLGASNDELGYRAEAVVREISCSELQAEVGHGTARIGGGALPRGELDSVTVDIKPKVLPLDVFARLLRASTPPIVGYVADGRYRVDLRTVFPSQDKALAREILRAIRSNPLIADHLNN